MPQTHDRGGWPTTEPIDQNPHQISDWERKIEGIMRVLQGKGLMHVDELRRAIEDIPQTKYEAMSYYERWADALLRLMHEKSVVTIEELEQRVEEIEAKAKEGSR